MTIGECGIMPGECGNNAERKSAYQTLYHGLAIYTELIFVNVSVVEAVPPGGGPAVV